MKPDDKTKYNIRRTISSSHCANHCNENVFNVFMRVFRSISKCECICISIYTHTNIHTYVCVCVRARVRIYLHHVFSRAVMHFRDKKNNNNTGLFGNCLFECICITINPSTLSSATCETETGIPPLCSRLLQCIKFGSQVGAARTSCEEMEGGSGQGKKEEGEK